MIEDVLWWPGRRPPLPSGPCLVAGLGEAGRAAALALRAADPARPILAWAQEAGPSTPGTLERLRTAGVDARVGPWETAAELPWNWLVKSPGLTARSTVVRRARERRAPVLDEAEVGWRLGRWPLIAITGTDGKGTVCRLVAAILQADGRRPVMAGNMEDRPPFSGVASDADVVVGEVSSFQLEFCPALLPQVAVLTNITRDHLDRHGSMSAYVAAKRRLFYGAAEPPPAVIGVDQDHGRALADAVASSGSRVLRCGRAAVADVRVEECDFSATASRVRLRLPDGSSLSLSTNLPGEHNARNVATAVGVAWTLGIGPSTIAAGTAEAVAAHGRFELVDEGQAFLAVVDYAHTPEGVRQVLTTARALAGGRVRVVLSASGEVDRGKRPILGRTAVALADQIVLSTDSSYHEPVEQILRELAADVAPGSVEIEADRGAAVQRVVDDAEPGDVVVILGRGPEPVLLRDRSGVGRRFDDIVALRASIRASGG